MNEIIQTCCGASGNTLSSGLTGFGFTSTGSGAAGVVDDVAVVAVTEVVAVVAEVVAVVGVAAVVVGLVAVAVVFCTGTHSDSFIRWVLPLDTGKVKRSCACCCNFS